MDMDMPTAHSLTARRDDQRRQVTQMIKTRMAHVGVDTARMIADRQCHHEEGF
jgi:hypothetical protein